MVVDGVKGRPTNGRKDVADDDASKHVRWGFQVHRAPGIRSRWFLATLLWRHTHLFLSLYYRTSILGDRALLLTHQLTSLQVECTRTVFGHYEENDIQ